MELSRQELVEFWNKRASTFPRYNEEPGSYEDSMLRLACAHGIDFTGKRVLDVGAGSGMYTLKIAQKAREVVAIDVSDEMLEISRADGRKLGLTNIKYVLSDWSDFKSSEQFDVVFCSMCPAVKQDSEKLKLMNAASQALIFIGFNDYRDPQPLAQLIDHYGLTRKSFKSGPDMRSWLTKNDFDFTLYSKTGTWVKNYSLQEALSWCEMMLKDLGAEKIDPALIKERLRPFYDQTLRKYVVTSPYFVEMIIWERKAYALAR
ncbi:MAG: class I SAM-dependent methyltransferase [Deltaproteobacteria bacterium]|jgi:SAM-dependent methyltransferase|nr:class I SAM-dependent methyltransferase [Deltaproteobacteria bacterium]